MRPLVRPADFFRGVLGVGGVPTIKGSPSAWPHARKEVAESLKLRVYVPFRPLGAVVHQHTQRIGVEAAAQFSQLHACLLGGGDIEARGRQEGPAGNEMEAGDIELHALDETFDIGHAGEADTVPAGQLGGVGIIGIKTQHGRAVEPQSDGGHTAIEVLEDLRIGNGGIGVG